MLRGDVGGGRSVEVRHGDRGRGRGRGRWRGRLQRRGRLRRRREDRIEERGSG